MQAQAATGSHGLALTPWGKHALLAAGGVLGGAVFMLCIRDYGLGVSSDSVAYLSAARSLASEGRALLHSGEPFTRWPPLYPFLLLIIQRATQVDPLAAAGPLNALVFAFIVYLSGVLFFRHLTSPALSLLGTALVLVSPALAEVSLMAWSEPLFLALTLASLIFLEKWLAQARLSTLVIASVCVALACLTRYIGLTLIATGLAAILLFSPVDLKTKGKSLALFTAIAFVPLGLWLLRNQMIMGGAFGPRGPSLTPLLTNSDLALQTLLLWYLPRQIVFHLSLILPLAALGGLALGGLYRRGRAAAPGQAQFGRRPLRVLGLFVVTYAAFLLLTAIRTDIGDMSNRLLSPILVPVTVLLFSLADSQTSKPGRLAAWARPVLVAGLGLSLLNAGGTTAAFLRGYWNEGGLQFTRRTWRESETIAYLRQHGAADLGCTLYSNGPEPIYLLTSLTAKWTLGAGPRNVEHWPPEAEACLVWFDGLDIEFITSLEGLQALLKLEPIVQLSDGTIYTFVRD